MKILGTALGSALLGWLVTSPALFILFKTFEAQSTHPDAYQITAIALVIIMGSLPTCLVSTATLGLGWHRIALKRGWRRKENYWIPGSLIGAVVSVAMSLGWLFPISFASDWWPWVGVGTLYAAVCGDLTGLFAWLIRRPDRDQISAGASKSTSA